MDTATLESWLEEIMAKTLRGEDLTEEEMNQLRDMAIDEVNSFIPPLVLETAHHLGHGDEFRDLVATNVDLLLSAPVAAEVIAAVLITKLAELVNQGVDIGALGRVDY